ASRALALDAAPDGRPCRLFVQIFIGHRYISCRSCFRSPGRGRRFCAPDENAIVAPAPPAANGPGSFAATLARFPLPSAPVEGYGSCRRSPRPAMSRSFASFLLIVCTMFWGFAFIAQKSAMDSMGPLTFAGVRFLIGGLLVLPLALHERRRRPIRLTASHWSFIAAMSTVFFLGSWLQQAGLATTT